MSTPPPPPSLDELLGDVATDLEHSFVEDFSTLACQCVLVVEFCERIGPRVIHRVPTWCGAHFNVDTLALWLSCTAHLQSTTVNQVGHADDTDETPVGALPFIDVQVIAQHTMQGIHTYAHHFTLYDVSARGFVRTFCLAFCAPHEASFTMCTPYVRRAFQRSVLRLRACNSRRFDAQLAHSLMRLGKMLQEKTNTYYELYYDNNMKGGSEKIADSGSDDDRSSRALSSMRRVHRTLQTAHTALRQQQLSHDTSTNFDHLSICTCDLTHLSVDGHDDSDSSTSAHNLPSWLMTLLAREAGAHAYRPQHAKETPADDTTIDNSMYVVSPCQYEQFCAHVRRVWSRCNRQRRHSRADSFCAGGGDCVARMNNRPLIYMNTGDMQQSMSGSMRDSRTSDSRTSANRTTNACDSSDIMSTSHCSNQSAYSNSSTTDLRDISYDSDDLNNNSSSLLTHMCHALPRLIAPLWTGQMTIVCSAKESRTPVAQRLVRLLHTLLLTGAQTAAHSLCLRWHRGRLPPEAYCTYKLCGVHATPSHSVAENIRPFVCIMDMDADTVHVKALNAKILTRACNKLRTTSMYLTDACVQSTLYACAAHYAWLANAYYHYARAPLVRTVRKPTFASLLRLEEGDMKIIRYMCELTRVGVRTMSASITSTTSTAQHDGSTSDDDLDVIDDIPVTPAWQFDQMFVDFQSASSADDRMQL